MKVKQGDIFKLGKHRLMCGDSLSFGDLKALMNHKKAQILLTDPPYNIKMSRDFYAWKHAYKSEVKKFKDEGFDYLKFLKVLEQDLFKGAFFIFGSFKQMCLLDEWYRNKYGRELRVMIWLKNNFSIGRGDYYRIYETFGYGWKEEHKFYAERGKWTTDVWYVPRPQYQNIHLTQKPVPLFEKCIRHTTQEQEIVLDLFGGSGTTIIACENTNRIAYVMEKDPHFVGETIKRWEKYTGQKAQRC